MSGQSVSDASQISRVLTKVGHRASVARLLPMSITVVTVGVAALGGAILVMGHDWPQIGWLIAAGVSLGLMAIGAIALVQTTGSDIVARRIDHRLGLAEQLSSANAAVGTSADSPIVRLLLVHAGRAARNIDVKRAVPLATRPLGLSLAALLLAICGTALAFGLIYVDLQVPAQTPQMADAADAAPAITAENLDVLADLVAEDAERRNSDYLAALANSISSLAEKARNGAPQAVLETELQGLLAHAAAGYQRQIPDWMKGAGEQPAGIVQNALAFSAARQKAAEERARLAEIRGDGPKVSSVDMYNLPEDRLTASAAPQPAGNSPPSENSIADREGQLQNKSLGGGDTLARPMEDEAFASAGSLPVGAAAQSGKGESNIAGGGSEALAENSQYLETMADPTQSMSISADEVGEGSRIRMHMPTGADPSQTMAIGGSSGSDWSRQMAQIVTRQAIGPQASVVVSRYFNRPAKSAGQ